MSNERQSHLKIYLGFRCITNYYEETVQIKVLSLRHHLVPNRLTPFVVGLNTLGSAGF